MDPVLQPAGLSLGGLFVTSFVIGLSGAVMPGPITAALITHSARQGARAGALMLLGHGVLEGLLVLALVAGLAPYLTQPTVAGVIGAVGAVILIWLGVGMLRSLPMVRIEFDPKDARPGGPLRDGILLSLANPYWSLWWATVGLSLVVMAVDSGLGWWGLVVFYLGHISADFMWLQLLACLVVGGRRFLTDKVLRVVVGVCAVFLLCFALYFGYFAFVQFAVLKA